MELFKAIEERRSARRFLKKEIEPGKIKKIISAAAYAPSACNIQGWKFIIVNKQKIKEKMVNKGTIEFIKFAPIGILVTYDKRSENAEYKDHIQSASAAIQNMLLAAHSLGIGSCWVCHLPPKTTLRKIFRILPYYDPIAYIALGYYKNKPKKMPRRYDINDIISFNRFNFKDNISLKTSSYRLAKRMAFKLYKYLPFKKFFLPITRKFEKFN